jgi:hypothetical protein
MFRWIRTLLEWRRARQVPGTNGESDVTADLHVARSRATGGRATDQADSATSTGTGRSGTFVGRVAGDDLGHTSDSGDTRAERRPQRQED